VHILRMRSAVRLGIEATVLRKPEDHQVVQIQRQRRRSLHPGAPGHTELMKSVARRISDRHMLHLIKMWLQMPVEETDERGHTQRTTRNLVLERSEGKDEHCGTPQGAPISPLLSNLYMRRFVLGWKTLGHAERLKAQIVNYADDFVICCRGAAGGGRAGVGGQKETV